LRTEGALILLLNPKEEMEELPILNSLSRGEKGVVCTEAFKGAFSEFGEAAEMGLPLNPLKGVKRGNLF
jgi:hypothetical protein